MDCKELGFLQTNLTRMILGVYREQDFFSGNKKKKEIRLRWH